MCGIFGVVGSNLPHSALEDVLHVLEHRGPDGNGFFVDESARVTIAHTRLAVIDLTTGILSFLGDRTEMAHSIEARVPFLDHKLYDKAKRIPVDFKMRNGLEKAVLRDAAKGILPEDLRLGARRGSCIPTPPKTSLGRIDI